MCPWLSENWLVWKGHRRIKLHVDNTLPLETKDNHKVCHPYFYNKQKVLRVCKPVKHFQALKISVLEDFGWMPFRKCFLYKSIIKIMNVLHLGKWCHIWNVQPKGKRLVASFNDFWRTWEFFFLDSSFFTQSQMKGGIRKNWKWKQVSWSGYNNFNKASCTYQSVFLKYFSSVQLLSRVQLFVTPWIAARQVSLSITNSRSLLKLMPIELVMPSSHLILCGPLLLTPPSSPSIGVFSNESTHHMRWPKYGVSASASVLPMNIQDWSPLGWTGWISLQSKGLSRSLLKHHSSKASIFQLSAFFTDQLSHPYMTTGKNIALIRWTFVGKVMSLVFTMLSKLVMTFLPRSKCLLISWLQSPSAVILEPPQNNVCHCFHCFPICFP